VQLEETKYFCCCCCRSGPLNYVAYLPAKGYIPGQDIPVTVEIENGSNVKVRGVTCELIKVSVSFSLISLNSVNFVSLTLPGIMSALNTMIIVLLHTESGMTSR